MAGYTNNMTRLLNKIENRLGLKLIKLPKELSKESWAENIIIPETIETFSRYYPHQVPYLLDLQHPKKDGWYYLDEDRIGGFKILGVKDIDWQKFSQDSLIMQQNSGYGIYDFLTQNYGIDDIGLLQMRADILSCFNTGIYPVFEYPNKLRIESVTGTDVGKSFGEIPIILLVEHSPNLTTISPTQMETFEQLAIADVANDLYNNLKYFDGLETVYATIDMRMGELQDKGATRADIVAKLEESYVSAGNKNQPIIMCI